MDKAKYRASKPSAPFFVFCGQCLFELFLGHWVSGLCLYKNWTSLRWTRLHPGQHKPLTSLHYPRPIDLMGWQYSGTTHADPVTLMATTGECTYVQHRLASCDMDDNRFTQRRSAEQSQLQQCRRRRTACGRKRRGDNVVDEEYKLVIPT
jgi:hypothetical protein